MAFWQNVLDWLSRGGLDPIVWSGVTLVLASAVYLFLRVRLRSYRQERAGAGSGGRLLGLGIFVIVLFVLARIWAGWAIGDGLERTGTGEWTLLENGLWTFIAAAGAYILVRAAQGVLVRSTLQVEARHKMRQATGWLGVLAFLIAVTVIWASRIQNIGVFLGIVGAGVALSLQETLLCIAGWMVLVVRRPFDIGDRIEIDGRIGDVIGVSVVQTSLLEVGNWVKGEQSTGRMLIIPNSMLVRHALYNYSKGFPFIWNEFSAVVTFESDWEQAKALMLEKAEIEADKIEKEVTRQIELMQTQYAIRYEQLRPIVYTSIASHGVELTLRYLSAVRMRRATTDRISQNILRAFREHPRIDFAYPTTRIYRNPDEGKPAVGGPAGGQRHGTANDGMH